jgi:tetratricopeptide (TPR) repeat protein
MKVSDAARDLCRVLFVLGLAIALAVPAYALPPGYPQSPYAGDSREMALLPSYCMYTQAFRDVVPGGNNQEEIKRWTSVMGAIFNAMHHYCAGLIQTNRAILFQNTPQERGFYLGDANGEFDYVIERAPQDFYLLPEILTKKGQNLIRLGKGYLSTVEFNRAIELRPEYWQAYAGLSDFYKSTGDFKRAREYLEKGLLSSPDADGLKRRMTEIDAAKRKTVPKSTEPSTKPR